MPAQEDTLLKAIRVLAARLEARQGFLGITLKRMSGESTMVRNYPPEFKGNLAAANEQAAAQGRPPYSYILLVRFTGGAALHEANLTEWLNDDLAPAMVFPAPGADEAVQMKPLAGIYASVIAGDRTDIFDTGPEIAQFLARQADTPAKKWVTVVNHVSVPDPDRALVEAKVAPLLKVAQNTFRPADDPEGIGQPGSRENHYYRKALSTEILANTESRGDLRNYLMHGVWESVWDHENSHLDERFQKAFLPLVPYVVVGPSEPFYRTMLLENRA